MKLINLGGGNIAEQMPQQHQKRLRREGKDG